jgi:hypothetical protein
MMRRRQRQVVVCGLAFTAVLAVSLASWRSSQGQGGSGASPNFVLREQAAPPAVKAILQQARAANPSYQVGYTKALERALKAGLAERARVKAISAKVAASPMLLQASQADEAQAAIRLGIKSITGLVPPPPSQVAEQAQNLQASAERRLQAAPSVAVEAVPRRPTDPKPGDSLGDWRFSKVVMPARDQGQCGCCWAFGTVGALESAYHILNGGPMEKKPLRDLSEQYVIDCNGAWGCEGGWWAFPFLISQGTPTESQVPFQARDDRSCPQNLTGLVRASVWGYAIPENPMATPTTKAEINRIKEALCQYGPLAAAINATPQFLSYTGGVYNEPGAGGPVNHAIIIVGWSERKQAWAIKNSWTSAWGEKGFAYVAYGSNAIGTGAAWVRPISVQADPGELQRLQQTIPLSRPFEKPSDTEEKPSDAAKTETPSVGATRGASQPKAASGGQPQRGDATKAEDAKEE